MAFRGIFEHNIDTAGRLMIPKPFRPDLAAGAVLFVTKNSLRIFPVAVWEEKEAPLRSRPLLDPKAERARQLLYVHLSQSELDGQGRVLIPAKFRKAAQLEDVVELVGTGDYVEIWNPTVHVQVLAEDEAQGGLDSPDLQGLF
jgi:MraZ protein